MRPPLPRAVQLANLPVASLLRNFWNIRADHPLELFLQPVTSGWTGLCSALPTMVLSFMSTYQHQLNHPNPHVRASTRHGLLQALTRFHRDMPCLQQGVHHVCPAHSDDHSLFVIWCHRLSIDMHVPHHALHMPPPMPPLSGNLPMAGGRCTPLDVSALTPPRPSHPLRVACSLPPHLLPDHFLRCYMCAKASIPGLFHGPAGRCLYSGCILVPDGASFRGCCACPGCGHGSLQFASHSHPHFLRQLILGWVVRCLGSLALLGSLTVVHS